MTFRSSSSASPSATLHESTLIRVAPVLPLSIDWEDWFQLCCAPYDGPDALDSFECRLPVATERTLALCDDLGAKATWFCLVDQTRRHPDLLRSICAKGHKISLHGMSHRRVFEMNRATFRARIVDGRKALEDITGVAVRGFRAPEWSLRGASADFWKEIQDLGFHYDSSRAPLAYLGSSSWPRRAHQISDGFWEFPPPVAGIGPATVPLWGWGMRKLPTSWLQSRVQALALEDAGTPLVVHPWELDEDQPVLQKCGLIHHLAHYTGLRGYGQRLRGILRGVRLISLEEWLELQTNP